ncbi:MAG: hydroxyacid dehydrogenase [Oscillospiraceae bacterium]|nr:hydroxyacid dehydrogenase [Oscillospiraceae bacterium]
MLVFLKDYIYPPAAELLKQHAEVVDNWDRIGEIDAIIARGTRITADIIEKAANLKVIAKHGIGVNTIDVEAATKRGIPVINTPLSNADSVAELTVARFLMLERRLYEANVKSREGSFKTKGPSDFLGNEINGKTFGQIGMGNIAQRIAYIMGTGFRCKVLGYDPFVSAEEAAKRGFEKVETVEELLERSDLVNVNVPLVKSTRNLVSREAMTHFKPGAVFVNAARGEVIDEDALYDALAEGRLKAAACDTFVEEPVSPDNKLLTLRNFSATPHLGGNTEEALQKTGMQVVQDTLAVLNGDFSTAHRVN